MKSEYNGGRMEKCCSLGGVPYVNALALTRLSPVFAYESSFANRSPTTHQYKTHHLSIKNPLFLRLLTCLDSSCVKISSLSLLHISHHFKCKIHHTSASSPPANSIRSPIAAAATIARACDSFSTMCVPDETCRNKCKPGSVREVAETKVGVA